MSEHYSDNPAYSGPGASNNVTDAEKEDIRDAAPAPEPEPEIVEAEVLDPVPEPVENDESAAEGDPEEPIQLDSAGDPDTDD